MTSSSIDPASSAAEIPASLTWRSPTTVRGRVLVQSSLIFWLIETLRPKVIAVVAVGSNPSPASFQLAVHAVTKAGLSAMTVLSTPSGVAVDAPVSAEAKATTRVVQGDLTDLHREFAPGTIDLLLIDGQPTEDQVGPDFVENWRALLSPSAVVLWHDMMAAQAKPTLEALGARPTEIASAQSGSGMVLAVIGDDAPASVTSLRLAPAGGTPLAFLSLLMRLGEGQEAAAEVAHLRGQIRAGASPTEVAEQAGRLAALQESLDQIRQGYEIRHERAVASAVALDDYRRGTATLVELLRKAATSANPADILTATLAAEDDDLPDALREVVAVVGRLIQHSSRLLDARLDDIVAIERDALEEAKASRETIARDHARAPAAFDTPRTDEGADTSLRGLERQLKQAEEQARKAQNRLHQIESSTSWRITRPLRGAKSLLNRSKD